MPEVDRLTQAVSIEKKARELEAQGNAREALQQYQQCLAIFEFIYKYEANPTVKNMYRDRMMDLVTRAENLKASIAKPTTPTAAVGGTGQAHRPPGGGGGGGGGGTPGGSAGAGGGSEVDEEKQKMRSQLSDQIISEIPNVKWDEVAGLVEAKSLLQETLILPMRCPHLFTGARKPFTGILLYGPPGTGKSYLAKACATECDSTFFAISSADLVSKWVGESEKLVKTLFEMAREPKSAIVFIDEVDSLTGARGGSGESESSRRIKTEIMAQMDGVGKTKGQLLTLGATNCPWDMDDAILRRFQKKVYIALPEEEDRITLLKIHFGSSVPKDMTDDDFREIASLTHMFSGYDMKTLVGTAMFEPVKRMTRAKTFVQVSKADQDGVVRQYFKPCSPAEPGAKEMSFMDVPGDQVIAEDVGMQDLLAALETTRPSSGEANLARYQKWTEEFGMDG
mmetsp:Transcript_58237/g.101979  ORF Transcript_58237/g.101979 Transcript_58237/m.101979 type:complete len:452 (-) Transcript_58237:99-1454(-)